jgi:cation diffusion facilitator CzcD-associated flavoprotein CzcO
MTDSATQPVKPTATDLDAAYDIVIIGAGLSGIAAAYHLMTDHPEKSIVILEGRAASGGTWDLFRYPGIRSDSDMFTLGFSFNPWPDPRAIADGPAILDYIHQTTRKFGIDEKIRYQRRVLACDWSSEAATWTLTVSGGPDDEAPPVEICCGFLFSCTGYYDYAKPHAPDFPGQEDFAGRVVHPQHWDDGVDYAGKDVVVIGSGATAVTLVPELAKRAASVTMLQRSPTYIMNLPSQDAVANFLRRWLPASLAHGLARWKNIGLNQLFYTFSRTFPGLVRQLIRGGVRKELGPDFDLSHFEPRYDPWDQRLCLVPDADLFKSLRAGSSSIVTDTIERFTPGGILLHSGRTLPADLIVTATGLRIQILGGIAVRIDGETVDSGRLHCYRGVMFGGVPNFAVAIGYTNASWTLKCDLNASFVSRLLRRMDRKAYRVCTPHFDETRLGSEPLLDFNAGYVRRADGDLPRQGTASPWRVHQNYFRDLVSLRMSRLEDEYLRFR